MPRHLFALAALLVGGVVGVASTQTPPARPSGIRALDAIQSLSIPDSPELAAAINDLLSDTSSHMRMAPHKQATADDSARAASVVTAGRAALSKYKDVHAAEADGYVKFLPQLEEQPIFHYNNIQNAFASFMGFDATKPVSLLYRKNKKGEMELAGAMYNAPPNATPEDLDARLPLGIAHWHEHVNFCGPTRESIRDGTAKTDPATAAMWLRITSRDECLAAGGRFVPRMFGWMTHVYLWAGDDPASIWGGEGKAHMH
ncbi:MAG: hypothetical protein M3081_16835 [Gemmatimonadota bacterium]|nr:hypothetical protein [Gemmatimonadota bacterium]